MKRHIETTEKNSNPSASVIDGTLVLSLPDAVTPVVWQLDFSQTKASAMEVREKEGFFNLVVKTPRGDIHEIASYDSKSNAVRALMSVSNALERAHNHLRPAANTSHAHPVPAVLSPSRQRQSKGFAGKAVSAFLAIIVTILLISIIMNIGPRRIDDTALSGQASSASSPATTGSGNGEPVSADAFLQRNR